MEPDPRAKLTATKAGNPTTPVAQTHKGPKINRPQSNHTSLLLDRLDPKSQPQRNQSTKDHTQPLRFSINHSSQRTIFNWNRRGGKRDRLQNRLEES